MNPWLRFVPFYRRYVAALSRVSALEMALTTLLENPRYVSSPAVGFNGQHHRKRVFLDLFATCPFLTIVETGTFIGNTTGFMAESTTARIHTCEANPIFHSLAKSRVPDHTRIAFYQGDSRTVLRELLAQNAAQFRTGAPVFFYLDAHWHDDLPLDEEISLIAAHVGEFAIMIDDFQVPDDPGYGYDNYGKGKSLDLATFGALFHRLELQAFFPSLKGEQETGGRRGCVVLARRGPLAEKLATLASLRMLPAIETRVK